MKNRNAIINIVSKLIIDQKKDVQVNESSTKTSASAAYELKKIKELLELRVITQEDFDAKISNY